VVVRAKSNRRMVKAASNGMPREAGALAPPRGVGEHATSPVESEPAAFPSENRALYLIGRPTLKQFLRHVRHNAAEPQRESDLIDEWNAANDVVGGMQKSEAGAADNARIVQLGPEYSPLLANLFREPLIRHGFNTVPTEVAMVDLDRVVVYQKHIDISHADRLQRDLPSDPSNEQIFELCLPRKRVNPPVKWSRAPRDKYVFVSPSNDLRFLGIMPLKPRDIPDYPPPGNFVGVVGIAVGFGSNFLNAIYAEKRLILRNGSHRAYMLYKRGFRHVPCIIQHVKNREELDLVGSPELERHPDHFLKHPRPPMLRDYFNPALCKFMEVQPRLHQVTVEFSVEETELPAL